MPKRSNSCNKSTKTAQPTRELNHQESLIGKYKDETEDVPIMRFIGLRGIIASPSPQNLDDRTNEIIFLEKK
jgi:hypothetical protein